jgi:hypothetical protein
MFANGVGRRMYAIWSDRSFDRSGFVQRAGSPTECAVRRPSHAVGVASRPGEEEPSLPLVGGADVGCSDTCPLRIEPDFGKSSEDDIKARSPSNDGPHVFQQEEAGS